MTPGCGLALQVARKWKGPGTMQYLGASSTRLMNSGERSVIPYSERLRIMA